MKDKKGKVIRTDDAAINTILACLKGTRPKIEKAATKLAALLVDVDGTVNQKRRSEVYAKIEDATSTSTAVQISFGMLDKLLKVGRGLLHPALYLDASERCRVVGMLPLELQTKLIEVGHSVGNLISGKVHFTFKKYAQLSVKEARTVCGIAKLLTKEEQQKILESKVVDLSNKIDEAKSPDIVLLPDGRLRVNVPMTWTIAEMQRWTSKMQSAASAASANKKAKAA